MASGGGRVPARALLGRAPLRPRVSLLAQELVDAARSAPATRARRRARAETLRGPQRRHPPLRALLAYTFGQRERAPRIDGALAEGLSEDRRTTSSVGFACERVEATRASVALPDRLFDRLAETASRTKLDAPCHAMTLATATLRGLFERHRGGRATDGRRLRA